MLFKRFRESLMAKMILSGGVTLLLCVFLWSGFNVFYFKRNVMSNVMTDIGLLSDTILLGLHYAMMLDSEKDIVENINNISKQEEIRNIRVYNKEGEIVFSNEPDEVGKVISMESPECWTCHQFDTPPATMDLKTRSRMMENGGREVMGIMTPIANSPGCAGGPCHVHEADEQILGLLDVTVDMAQKNAMISTFERANVTISVVVFMATFLALFHFGWRFIYRPIKRFIIATRGVSAGDEFTAVKLEQVDEIGTLADAFNMMGQRVAEKHRELMEQREEFRNLFDNVPCLVSVVDRDYYVIRYNNAYEQHFGRPLGRKKCWAINKGRTEKCEICPVERTFNDGLAHMSEESGLSKDGLPIHWIVYTSPVRDKEGNIVAAMEMMLDITRRKELEGELSASEHRYHAIFDSIPSAVFVLAEENLEIINCNEAAEAIYGWSLEDLQGRNFLEFFRSEEEGGWEHMLRTRTEIELCTHVTRTGKSIFVFMRISPARFDDRNTLIVTCSDVTKKLETEQQLIQASKMSTLGEMATGVAHELNQPLTILKAIANLLSRKVTMGKSIEPEIVEEMADGINTHVDRASKIIEHMREFGRKADMRTMPVQINEVLERGFEFFSQQLKVHNIEVIWETQEDLPLIMADSNRLEQVVINLLLNARDAIEDRWQGERLQADKRIQIKSFCTDEHVTFRVCDTGAGIPESIRERLFEPFFTTKDVGKGTGLGLSISYGIVSDYGGDIKAVSWEGEGACFEISFPRECEV